VQGPLNDDLLDSASGKNAVLQRVMEDVLVEEQQSFHLLVLDRRSDVALPNQRC
jgi:hypothetical protein